MVVWRSWEALAHGAEVVSYFRWRQAPFAQEQNHAGLNLAGLSELSVGGKEAGQVGAELNQLGKLPNSIQAPVAIVYDYEASWITRIQPQGQDFLYHELVFRWYEAVRRLGVDVDFVPPGHKLDGYQLVLVPSLPHVSDAAYKAFEKTKAVFLFGPRTGSKTRDFAIPKNLAPGELQELLNTRITQVSSLRPGVEDKVKGKATGTAIRWREYLDTKAQVLARFENKDAALIANGNHHYLACWPDQKLLFSAIEIIARKAKLKITKLPESIRLRRRGKYLFAFNYGTKPWKLALKGKLVHGKLNIAPQGFAIIETA